MLGQLSDEVENIQETGRLFDKCKNCCGEVETVTQLLKTTSFPLPESFGQWIIVRSLERLLRLATLLYKPIEQRSLWEHSDVEKCEEHIGLFTTETERQKAYFCKQGGRFSNVDPDFVQRQAYKVEENRGQEGYGRREKKGQEAGSLRWREAGEKFKKASFCYLLLLTSSQRNEPNNVS